MWQEVSAGDPVAVLSAFDTLSVRDSSFGDLNRFVEWIKHRIVHYFRGPDYEIVIGFRFRQPEGEWRVATVGHRGSLRRDAIDEVVQHVVSFMRSHDIRTLFANTRRRPASSVVESIFQRVAAVARSHPDVSEISTQQVKNEVRWKIVLK